MGSNEKQNVVDAIRDWLLEAWLDSIEWDMPQLLEAVERGIPETWAEAIAEQSGGRVTVKLWPHVIKSPKIASRMGKPFLLPPETPRHANAGQAAVGKRPRRENPAQLLLRRKGVTVSALHREIAQKGWDYTRSTVSAWFAEDDAHVRGIPEEIADYIAGKYGIPKTSWQKVLRKD